MFHSMIITFHPLIQERRTSSYTLNEYLTVLTNNGTKCGEAFMHASRKIQNGSHDSAVDKHFKFKWTSAFLQSNVDNEKVRLDCTVIQEIFVYK